MTAPTRLLMVLAATGCTSVTDDGGAIGSRRFAGAGRMLPDDFATVVAADHPAGAGQYEVWYDAADNTFGTPSAATLGGQPAMRIDDGGFTNGVYSIYEAAIPGDGTYALQVTAQVVEPTAFDGIRAFQIGAAVGAAAVHRGPNPSALPPLAAVGSYAGLTPADDTALGPQVLTTTPFVARAGDDLLVAFGTDVASGGWNLGSGTWSGSHVLVSDLQLVPVDDPSLVVDDDLGPYAETGAWSPGSGVGYAGGGYRYAIAGGAATATWTAALPAAGGWRVEAMFLAGANRASSAVYTVETAGGPVAVPIDQATRSLSWVRLGRWDFDAGPATVTLDAQASEPAGAVVVADAIRFVPEEAPPQDPPEMRLAAITVFDDIDDVDSIQRTVDALRDLHYNAVAVHARYRGDATYFPNRVDATFPNSEPRSPAAGDVDVLGEFVERGHRAGLKVFAYVNTHLVTSGATPELRPEHVVNQHPDWRTWAYNGGNPVVQTAAEDPDGLWLEPALPEVADYLADIAGDIVSNYDCDGIVLDRIRYPQTGFVRADLDFGYHPVAIDAFHACSGGAGVPDPSDPAWIAFRQDAITDTVAGIHRTITAIDPDVQLLAYPIGRLDDAVAYNYQDWPTWLERHALDGVMPQIYTADPALFDDRLVEHRLAYAGDRLLGVTTDGFRAGVDVADQLEAARAAGFDGASPFRYGTLDGFGYLDDLALAWDGVADWPTYPGQGAPIAGLRVCGDRDGAGFSWTLTNPNPAALWYRWVDLASGQTGEGLAPPGASALTTPAAWLGVLLVEWYDEQSDWRLGGAVAGWPGC
ncbi:MAG: family 10 glycosylhydrolase [Myxococcota bacterium]